VLGHGAGGGVEAGDLRQAVAAARALGWTTVRVEQPYRVAGRRVSPAPARLDEGWLAVLAALEPHGPVVVGGRSAGARVACRTALRAGARAVLCLAFPLHPPGRPDRSRAPELAGAGVPAVVVQGERDPFGGPADLRALALPMVEVIPAPGGHSLAAATEQIRSAVARVISVAVA
jgi:predicted alpha/beta-hydrolase family hydrolase